MKCKLIAVVSKDGFIARYSGDIPSDWTSKEEQKYFIKDMNVFFDVGGHHGETTIWFLKFFKIKEIYIFEPIGSILRKIVSKI